MQVVKGNLTQQQVAAIVNPTNNQLGLTGGVSKHIAKAAGPDLEKACQALLASLPPGHKAVPVGSSAVTSCSGNSYKSIPCQHIIHAVGPHYNGKRTLICGTAHHPSFSPAGTAGTHIGKREEAEYTSKTELLHWQPCPVDAATADRPSSLLLLGSCFSWSPMSSVSCTPLTSDCNDVTGESQQAVLAITCTVRCLTAKTSSLSDA